MFGNHPGVVVLTCILSLLAGCQGDSPTQSSPPPPAPIQPPAPNATTVSVSPDSVVLGAAGDTARFTATVKDQNGNSMTGLTIVWSSSDTTVVQVSSIGLVTTAKPGTAMISATIGSLKAASKVAVKLQMNARCRIPTGTPVKGAVAGLPSFARASQGFNVQSPRYGMQETANGDFDGDGDEDLIVLSSNFPPAVRAGHVLFWRNVGGTFVEATAAAFGSARPVADHPRQIEIADLNGDRILDVFAAQHGYDTHPFDGAPDLLFLSQGGGSVREAGATSLIP